MSFLNFETLQNLRPCVVESAALAQSRLDDGDNIEELYNGNMLNNNDQYINEDMKNIDRCIIDID